MRYGLGLGLGWGIVMFVDDSDDWLGYLTVVNGVDFRCVFMTSHFYAHDLDHFLLACDLCHRY